MRFPRKTFAFVLSLVFFVIPVCAQQSAPAGALTNNDIFAMAAAGLSDSVILMKIRQAPSGSFDTSVAALKSLKAAGVSNAVITAMIDPTSAPLAPAPATGPATPTNPDDPVVPHDPGVYVLLKGQDGKEHLTRLEREMPSSRSGSNFSLITASHLVQELNHANANVQINNTKPVFYVYLMPDQEIRDMGLVTMKVKKDERVADLGRVGIFTNHASAGVNPENQQGYSAEQIAQGIYRIVLKEPLSPGEYGFQQTVTAVRKTGGLSVFYSFGVRPSA